MKVLVYKENLPDKTMEFIYGKNGYIEKQIDSNLNSKTSNYTNYQYNDKNELIYRFHGKDSVGSVTLYYYDNNGYNTRTINYSKNGNDTSYTKEYNKIVYKDI